MENIEKEVEKVMKFVDGNTELAGQLLGRMRTDCEYYIAKRPNYINILWAGAGNEVLQIETMKALYNFLSESKISIRMTYDDILKFEKEMK